MIYETRLRTLVKTFSWRIFSTFLTISLAFYLTQKLTWALFFGGFDLLVKSSFYFFHERLWHKIRYGKKTNQPFVIWMTGYSGAGKTTLALELEKRLKNMFLKVNVLDGDEIRKIFPNTGFTREERENHIQRVAHLASQLESNGIPVIVSLVSPFLSSREFARKICHNFIEVHVSTPLEICQSRDSKGLYKKAQEGVIKNFTGLGQDYEPPLAPELRLDTSVKTVEECVNIIMKKIEGYLK